MYPSSDQNLSYTSDDTVHFFSHAFDPLNNWSGHTVNIWGKKFPSVEHAYHYRKFSERDPKVAEAIRQAPSSWAAMQFERQHKALRRPDWEEIKVAIMTDIIRAKVAQNEDVRQCLIATGSKKIIENSPWDTFWGCGEDGKGQNMMGRILMQIRDELTPSPSH